MDECPAENWTEYRCVTNRVNWVSLRHTDTMITISIQYCCGCLFIPRTEVMTDVTEPTDVIFIWPGGNFALRPEIWYSPSMILVRLWRIPIGQVLGSTIVNFQLSGHHWRREGWGLIFKAETKRQSSICIRTSVQQKLCPSSWLDPVCYCIIAWILILIISVCIILERGNKQMKCLSGLGIDLWLH